MSQPYHHAGNGHQIMHVAASLEYGLELAVVWLLARQKLMLESICTSG